MEPSLGRFFVALGLFDGSLESNNMKRFQLMDSKGRICFDSFKLSTKMGMSWNALLLEAARGGLAMWQDELGDSQRHHDGPSLHRRLMDVDTMRELMDYLVERGALTEFQNENGDRPLALAAEAGFEAAVQALLELGANPIINNRDELPVLLQAVRAGHEGIVRLMLQHLPNVGLVDATTVGRALNHAAADGHLGMLQVLLDGGLAIDTPHYHLGSTALVQAALGGHYAAMHLLLDRGADVNFRNDNGFTPLLLLLNHRQEHSAGFLIEHGANVNSVSSQGVSPLMLTARSGTVAMAQLLLERGAEVNAQRMSTGWTALMSTAVNGNWAVMDVLRAAGAQMDAFNHAGASARTLAVDTLRLREDIMRGEGMDELTYAIEGGLLSFMSALLEVSATAPARVGDSAGQNNVDWGRLMRTALQAGNLLLTRELLAAVARIDAENFPALIALNAELILADDVQDWEMLDLLREFGADIQAPAVETNTTLLDLAVNAETNQVTNEVARQLLEKEEITGTIQAAVEESMQIVLQESIQVALQELVQAPVQETIQADIQAAIQAVVQETAQQAIRSAIQAAIQATTQVPNAVAMDGLLNAPLARASQYSHTEVEAIVELFLSTGQQAPAAVAGNALEIHALASAPQLSNAAPAISELEQGRIYPEAEAAADDHSDHGMFELPSTGDSNMVAEDDSTYCCYTPIFGNDCRIMPILLGVGIGIGANYYLGQFQPGLSLGKSPWEEYSVFGG